MQRTRAVGLGVLVLALLTGLPRAGAQTATAVAALDLDRLAGNWTEIARYPNKPEKKCVGDVFVLLAGGDKPNQIQVVNECKTKSGFADARTGTAKRKKKTRDGRLKVTYIWPFSSKLWVLGLGPNYEWAVVGSPNHKTLWIYSKTARMQPDALAAAKSAAAAQGFALDKLVMTAQSGR